MDEGILLIDKPKGWTSFDVVAKVRGVLRAKYRAMGKKPTKQQLKVGHAGTLDPFATGLLVVLVGGKFTKQASSFLKRDKDYSAVFCLGAKSDTDDTEGEIEVVSGRMPTRDEVEQALESFVGEIWQMPPAYSAIKIDGKRSYQMARAGKTVDLVKRQVKVDNIRVTDYQYPRLSLELEVGSGTYIRSIARDLGDILGIGAYCLELRRTRIGEMSLDDAIQVDDVEAVLSLHE